MSLTLTDRQAIWDTFCRTLTNDPNPAVRAKAATAIGLHHPTSIELIQSTAKNLINHSTDSQLRQSAIILLGKTALADSIPELITLLQDPDLDVVQAAIEALGSAAA
jgi:HEAT repeat protein